MNLVKVHGPTLLAKVERHKVSAIIALILILGIFATWGYLHSSKPRAVFHSIAVLPFVNESGDKETEVLSDGISETLINKLTRVPSLHVTARTTAFHYKGREIALQQISKELGVSLVLTGSVSQQGDTLKIQVDLIDTSNGREIWGEKYNGKASELLIIQQQIVQQVYEKLGVKSLTKRDTENTEAYRFYLKGRYYWNKRRNEENLRKAIEHFQLAVGADPNYALAYAGLADAYVLLEQYAGTPGSEAYPKAITYAQRALMIDNSLAEAHASLAYAYGNLWRWEDAEKEYQLAIEMNPQYATVYQWYCLYLREMDRVDEALTVIKSAQQLDPLSLSINQNVVIVYLWKGDARSAVDQSKEMVDLDDSYPLGHSFLGLGYLEQGRMTEALRELQKGVELSKEPGRPEGLSRPLSYLGYGYAVARKEGEARKVLKVLEETYGKSETTGVYIATVYAGLGDMDKVFAWLERDYEKRNGLLPTIKWYPAFKSIRSDPRYASLLRRMGLPS
jgi:TolB-like protein/Tfp pilus assembly protein PilF